MDESLTVIKQKRQTRKQAEQTCQNAQRKNDDYYFWVQLLAVSPQMYKMLLKVMPSFSQVI